jgi:hypothetical protein
MRHRALNHARRLPLQFPSVKFVSAPRIGHADDNPTGDWRRRDDQQMFAFFSNRLGCLGSLVVSIVGTILLLALMRSCGGPHW